MNTITRRDLLKAGALAGLSPLARYADALGSKPGSFTFVFFSDTHVRLTANIEENRKMLAEMVQIARPAFGINGGDVTDYGWAKEYDNYEALVKEVPFKIYDTAGNHDVRWSPQGVKIFKERLGDPFGYFQHQGCHFLILDSTVPLSHWGHYETKQLKWLEERLKRIGRTDPIFVTTHHWVGRDGVMIDNEDALRKILEPYNVKLILNGHGHGDLLWQWDGITNTMNRGLYQGSWEKIEVDREKDEVRLTRYATQKPMDPAPARKETLLATVRLAADRAKMPTWALSSSSLEAALFSAGAVELRVGNGAWAQTTEVPAPKVPGYQTFYLRDKASGRQTSFVVEKNPAPAKVEKLWEAKLSGGVMSHVKIDGEQLLVSALDGSVAALDKKTGKQLWKAVTGGYCHSSPVVGGGLVYVGSADAHFYAFNRKTGKQVWKAKTNGPVYASASVAGDTVCVASGDGYFYAFDAASGKQKWRYEMPKSNTNFAQSHATTDGKRFYIGAWDSHIYAIDVASGQLLWRKPCQERTFAFSPAIGGPAYADGAVYVPANGNGLFCFDAVTGEQRWMVASKGEKFGHSSPKVVGDRIVVGCLGDAGEVRCVSTKDGSELWMSKTGAVIYDSSPAFGDGFAAIGSVDGTVSMLALYDGAVLGQYCLPPGHLLSTPAAEGKTVYAGSFSDRVVALRLVG